MSYRLSLMFALICVTSSAHAENTENDWIKKMSDTLSVPLEVIKATGIAQKQLGYANDLPLLIRNGNTWSLAMALALKYGYNPLESNDALKKLTAPEMALALKDLAYYLFVTEQTAFNIAIEQQKKEDSHRGMIIEGSALAGASIAGLILLGVVPKLLVPHLVRLVVIPCLIYTGITGGKKAFNGTFYQEHLDNALLNNEIIKKTLMKTVSQLAQHAPESANDTLKEIEKVAGIVIEKIKNKISGEKK